MQTTQEPLLGKCFVCADRWYYRVTRIYADSTAVVQCVNFDLKWPEMFDNSPLGINDVSLIFLDGLKEIPLEQFAAALQTFAQSFTKEVPLC